MSPSGEATCLTLDADPSKRVLAKCVVSLLGDHMGSYSMLIPSIEVKEMGELPPSGVVICPTLDADPSM
jgi:hypothetical protein